MKKRKTHIIDDYSFFRAWKEKGHIIDNKHVLEAWIKKMKRPTALEYSIQIKRLEKGYEFSWEYWMQLFERENDESFLIEQVYTSAEFFDTLKNDRENWTTSVYTERQIWKERDPFLYYDQTVLLYNHPCVLKG